MSKAQGMQRDLLPIAAGWQPIVVDGNRGYRLGNWLTWMDPQRGWLWMWSKP